MYTMMDFNTNFSYLSKITPRKGDERYAVSCIDIENEILVLQDEMASIDTEGIKFDKWDYIVAFTLGLMEVVGGFLVGDHNQKNSLANQMADKSTPLGQAFESIHKKFDHSGQPLDYQGKGFGGGDHRVKTFCHDLLMFPLAIYMLTQGKFIDGAFFDGEYRPVITELNQNNKKYIPKEPGDASLSYIIHMVADFFSTKSLPIPGFSALTHSRNEKIQDIACKLYKDGLNLRNLVMQGIPVATVELVMWIYTALRYNDSKYTKDQIKFKREKMLFLSHGIASAINIGKVIIQVVITNDTKALTSLNLPMIIRTIQLVWKSIKKELQHNNNRIEKVSRSTLVAQLETEKTLILLDDCIYYTLQIDCLIADMKKEFDITNERRLGRQGLDMSDLKHLMQELKNANGETNND